jgi:hypothetical protein
LLEEGEETALMEEKESKKNGGNDERNEKI